MTLYCYDVPMEEQAFTLAELADRARVTPRTVRYYIGQGLLPSPGTTGPGARYSEDHLNRLRLIKKLQRSHLPLAEIRKQLADLSKPEVAGLLVGPTPVAGETAVDYIRSVLAAQARPAAAPTFAPAQHSPRAGSGGAASQPPPAATSPAEDVALPGISLSESIPLSGTMASLSGQAADQREDARQAELESTEQESSESLRVPTSVPFALTAKPMASGRTMGLKAPNRPEPSVILEQVAPRTREDAIPETREHVSPEEMPPPQRSEWERVALSPDIELHIRRPLSRPLNRVVARLIAMARQLLEEERR
jgi:DNA-binding transcriptional MerR regulator